MQKRSQKIHQKTEAYKKKTTITLHSIVTENIAEAKKKFKHTLRAGGGGDKKF